jgi:hypothetical protein
MENQTDELWLSDISQGDLGTGVFIFPSEFAGKFGSSDWSQTVSSDLRGDMTKTLLRNVDYPECVKNGSAHWMIAFKWVPKNVAGYDKVAATAGSCGKAYCAGRCADYGCLCVDGECK